MNEVRKKLTQQEKAHLSDLWLDKDKIRALKVALSHRQLWLAQFGIGATTDFSQVMQTRGQIDEDKWFLEFLEHNFKEGEKLRKLTQTQATEE